MTRPHLVLLTAATIAALGATGPADAGGSFAFGISNHGVSIGIGSSNWGIWGSSWDTGGVALGFSAALTGYGEWVRVDGLGRVWRPWVAAGWQPYTYGRWVWTSLGWTWVAYEPWGWVPHHYGNWAYSTIGWVWSPGYAYHPGNVVWVSSGAHVGWYPCAPAGWSHFNRGYQRGWNAGYADGWRDARYATWVPWSRLDSENVAHYAVGRDGATHPVARTGVVALRVPPTRTEVERRVGRPVPEARFVERKATVDGHQVRFVRPEGQVKEVMRHGAETIDRALAPAARNRVGGDGRGEVRPQTDRSRAERRPDPTVSTARSRPTAVVHRNVSPAAARARPAGPGITQGAVDPRIERSRSVEQRRTQAPPQKSSSTAEAGNRPGRDRPPGVAAGRSPLPERSAPRVRTTAGRSSSPQPATTTTVGRVRTEAGKEKAAAARRSGSRGTTDPAKEQQRKGRREKN